MTRTLTLDDARAGDEDVSVVRGPHLVLVLDAASPRTRPARFALDGLSEVQLGRGSRRSRTRTETTLSLALPDPFLSSKHAALRAHAGAWQLEDLGSKNGITLEGRRLTAAHTLRDGDFFCLGQQCFVFRTSFPRREGELDFDLAAAATADLALATLDAEAARELSRLVKIAGSLAPVLITGETGTGKEVVARAIHAHSGRRGPFVAINCGALPPTLVTSELFGVQKGAFSGATETRRGLVRSADQGTLFLDELAELPLDAQAALLRVLQEREVLAVGAERPVRVDVKIVAATHRDLEARVRDARFREDLLARVAGHRLTLRPLRERREDLGLLVGALLERQGATRASFTPEAARMLFRHAWPRNVRELEHALATAHAVAGDAPIGPDHLPATLRDATAERPALAAPVVDEAHFVAIATEHAGNVSAIARALGTSRSQVRRLAQRFGVELEALRG